MSADVRLSTGAQAVLDRRIRDLRLVQFALTDAASMNPYPAGSEKFRNLCATESDAIRQALNEIEAVLRIAQEGTGQ